jgi:nucleoside-diphosphate-sugar epimerase
VARLVVTGSGDETGSAAATQGFRRPDQAKEPRSVYAATKAAGTLFYEAACRFSEQRPTVLRLFAVYGHEQTAEFLIPSLLEALRSGQPLAMTGGEQRRDFVWLDDVLDVLLAIAANDMSRGRTIDVCTGTTYSLRQLVDLLSELSGRPVPARFGASPYRPGEPFMIAGDPEPLRGLVGMLLKTPLREGLRQLLVQTELLM